MNSFKIGDLAKRTATNAPTIRYYESIGLLPVAARQSGGQRIYGEEDVRRLTFIRRCRDFGFSIEQVGTLVTLLEDEQRSCMHVRDLAQEHLTELRTKLRELRALERRIAAFVTSCETSCAGGPGPDCTILADMTRQPPTGSRSRRARQGKRASDRRRLTGTRRRKARRGSRDHA